MSSPIPIPDDAPLDAEQRAWLDAFLGKALAGVELPAAATGAPAVPVTILFGSQTGNAEGLAGRMAKAMKRGHFAPEVLSMADYERAKLAGEGKLLVVLSTYGDGEAPDAAADFLGWLAGEGAPRLDGVEFSVMALGDSEYPEFCKCGVDCDARLAALGAERVFERVDADVDFDEPFNRWRDGVIRALGVVVPEVPQALATAEEEPYSKRRPFPASVLSHFRLTGDGSSKDICHIAMSLEGSGLEYEAGDALGVMPRNDPALVDEFLGYLPFKDDVVVPLPTGGEAPLREALTTGYDLRTLNKSLLNKWQQRSGSPFLRSLVEADDRGAYSDFCWGRELIDLAIDHPASFSDAEDFVSVLRKLQPRLYSIASSPKAHPGEVHLTVAVTRYHSHGRDRCGACSTYLCDRVDGHRPKVFIHRIKTFRLPEDGDTPVIMVGSGTGIAPFRAFLEERRATAAKGRSWLIFGNPHQATDYLYEEDLTAMVSGGVLNRLDLAWSRDQDYRIYVQDKMLEAGEEFWSWIENGAVFYVCGDAARMAKDVDSALHRVAVEHGGMSEGESVQFVKQMREDHRYLRDVY